MLDWVEGAMRGTNSGGKERLEGLDYSGWRGSECKLEWVAPTGLLMPTRPSSLFHPACSQGTSASSVLPPLRLDARGDFKILQRIEPSPPPVMTRRRKSGNPSAPLSCTGTSTFITGVGSTSHQTDSVTDWHGLMGSAMLCFAGQADWTVGSCQLFPPPKVH